jgi:hypothetical protein
MGTFKEITMWLLSLFSAAVLACWIAYSSTVVQKIKKFFWLAEDQTLPKWKQWFKPVGFLLESFKELTNCPYCLSWWFGLFINLLLWKITLPFSILYACLSIVFVEIYRKITL